MSQTGPSHPAPAPCPAPFNLARHVLAHAERLGAKSALQILRPAGAERWSFARLEAAVRGVATGLLARGLVPGDRVMLRLGNGPAFPLAYLGAIAAGIVPVPTAAPLIAPEVEKLVDLVAPRLIIAGPGIALPARPPCPVLPEAELLGFEDLPPAAYQMGNPDRLAYIVFTSGTSGRPRPVAHAHRAVWARRMMRADWTGLTEADRLFHAGALNWTYTLGVGLLDPWAVGATALVAADGVAPAQIPLLLKRFDVTIFAAVPGLYRKILGTGARLDLPRLRHGLSAGEALPRAVRAAWHTATGTDLHEALGMTECSTFISSAPHRPAPPGATGYPQTGRRITVLGPDGTSVPAGTEGQLAVHRSDPGLCLGVIEPGGLVPVEGDWFLTGDMVRAAGDGAITSLGRSDDLLNAGGFRIAPAEIEAAFAGLPGAGQTAAVEVEVKADTRVIALFYTGPADEAALARAAEGQLAPYKRPRLYRRIEALPVTANGKLNRRVLRGGDWTDRS